MRESKRESLFSSKALVYFLQLSESLNYTKAAGVLGITQPALSQQIKKLENKLHANLFYSVGKQIHLTDAGYTLKNATEEVYGILDNATDEIESYSSSIRGTIKVGILSAIEDEIFENFALYFYEKNPDLRIEMYMLTQQTLISDLESGKIDLAIMYLPNEKLHNWKGMAIKPILHDTLCYVHHDKSKVGSKINLKKVEGPIVGYPNGYYFNQFLKNIYSAKRYEMPKMVACFTRPVQIMEFALSSGLNTILPKTFMMTRDRSKMAEKNTYYTEIIPDFSLQAVAVYRDTKDGIPRLNKSFDEFNGFIGEYAQAKDVYLNSINIEVRDRQRLLEIWKKRRENHE